MRIQQLGPLDKELAKKLFASMAQVFGDEPPPLSDGFVDRLLSKQDFWAFAAMAGAEPVGGLTAHVLPMSMSESYEVFIYDIAVRDAFQRQGVGRQLVSAVQAAAAEAGIQVMFVAADNEDVHALDFYRALGAAPSAVTIFTFSEGDK